MTRKEVELPTLIKKNHEVGLHVGQIFAIIMTLGENNIHTVIALFNLDKKTTKQSLRKYIGETINFLCDD